MNKIFNKYSIITQFDFSKCFMCICFSLTACNKDVTRDGLIEYINNPANGLKKEQVIGDFHISAIYRPNDLMVAQDLMGKNINDSVIEAIKASYKPYIYFLVDLSYKDQEIINLKINSEESYIKAIDNLAFNMKEYCYIISSNEDTVYPTDCIYSRHYGMTGSNTVLLIFENEKIFNTKIFELIIEDHEFGFGKAIFKYRIIDVKKALKLICNYSIN